MKASEDYRTGLQWSKQKKYNLRNSQVWTDIEKRWHSKNKNSVIFISLTNIGYTYPFEYYWHFVLNRNVLYLVNRLKSRIRHPRHPVNKTFFDQITSHRAAEWQNRTTSNVDPRWRNTEPVSEMLGQRLVSFWGVQDIPIVPLNGFKFFQWQEVFWIPVNCAQNPTRLSPWLLAPCSAYIATITDRLRLCFYPLCSWGCVRAKGIAKCDVFSSKG